MSRWLSFLHPNVTLRIIIIAVFLTLIAIGNAFGIYDNWITGNTLNFFTSIIATLLYAVPAYGLFRLKSWARVTVLCLSLVFVAMGCIIALFANIAIGLFTIVFHGLIAAYMTSRECKQAFLNSINY